MQVHGIYFNVEYVPEVSIALMFLEDADVIVQETPYQRELRTLPTIKEGKDLKHRVLCELSPDLNEQYWNACEITL